MAGTQRETKLTLRVEALGQEDLKALQDSLSRLAKEGGDAAPEFQRLADEVSRLGDQAGTLAAFEKLAATTAELATKQQGAEQAAADLKKRLDEQRTSVAAAAAAQEQASQKYQEAKNELTDLGTRLKTLRAETDAAGKKTDEYRAAITSLIGKQGEQKKSLDDLRAARNAANQELSKAEAEETKLQRAYDRSRVAIDKAADALQQSNSALDGARASTEALGLSTEDVAASQAQLVAALNRTGAEAQALEASARGAANYIEFWSNSLDELDRNLLETGNAAKSAAAQISNAFGTVGIRGAQELETEIAQVRAAMDTLKNQAGLTGGALAAAMSAGNSRIAELERELRGVTNSLTLADRAANLFKNSLGQIAAGNLIADAVGSLVEKVKELGRQFITTTVETEQFRRGLNAIYKDAAITTQQFEFLRKTANDNGIAIGSVSQAFVRFSAATKGANIPIGVTNDLFASVTRTAGTLGLSAEATTGALDALGQIASKGTVSLEELRQQLGDRMPGALGAAAKGLGLTEAELIKLVESGNLAARDFFPAFTKGLQDIQGETEGLVPTWNRLKNAFTVTAQTLGDAGGLNILTAALRALAVAVGVVAIPLQGLAELVGGVARSLGILAGAVVTLTSPWEALGKVWTDAGDRLNTLNKAVLTAIGSNDENAASQTRLTQATATATQTTAAATEAVNLLALARKQDADATTDQSTKLVQFNVRAIEALKAQQVLTEAAEKNAKAVKTQGDTLVALTELRGNEQETLLAATTATDNYARAAQEAADSKQRELDILQLQLERLNASTQGRQADIDATKVQRNELENKIKTSQAEVEQSRASAAAAQQEVLVKRIAAETYRDNSAKIAEYRDALVAAQKELDATIEFKKRGVLTDKDVADAQTKVTEAQAKYNDSLADATRLQGAYAEARKSVSQLETAGLQLALAQAQASERKAVLDGNEFAARQAQIKQREIELELYKLKIKSMEIEAQGAIDVANATLAEKIAKGEVSAADQIRIANAIRLAEVKLLEAKALGTNVEAMERELQALKNGIDLRETSTKSITNEISSRGTLTGAISSNSDAMEKLLMQYTLSADYSERQIALLEREASAAEKAAEAKRKYWNVDKDGFTLDANGQRMQQSIPTGDYVFNAAKSAGLSEAQALQLMDQYFRNGEATGYQQANGLNGPSRDWFSVVNQAISDTVISNARTNSVVTPQAATRQTAATPQSSGGTRMINVNIGGQTRSFQVASESDANTVESIMRQLEQAARTAS